jgi:hypothetical protein
MTVNSQNSQTIPIPLPDNPNTYRLIEELIRPPKPVQPAKNGKAPAKRSAINSNVYTDAVTGEEYSNHRLRTNLTRKNFALGQQFSHQGQGLLEVYRDSATNKLQLRKVEV